VRNKNKIILKETGKPLSIAKYLIEEVPKELIINNIPKEWMEMEEGEVFEDSINPTSRKSGLNIVSLYYLKL